MKSAALLKQKIAGPRPVLGVICTFHFWPGLVELAMKAGLDYIIIDLEHLTHNAEQVAEACAIGRREGFPILIRPPAAEFTPVRLAMYKRLAAAPDNAAIDELTEEVVDRFGPLPPPATNLLRVARLKLTARALGIRRLDLGPQGGYALFEERNQVDPRAVIRLVQHPDRDYRLEGALKLRISRETDEGTERFEFAEDFLNQLKGGQPAPGKPESQSAGPKRK